MSTKGVESKWFKMAEKTIYSTPGEWSYARALMEERIRNGEPLPFKINRDNVNLSHSFLVAALEDGKPLLGVLAQGKDKNEGILGFGSFGVCKLVLWEDGTKNAIKIEPDNEDKHEIQIMQKLGLIRVMFKREWDKRLREHTALGTKPDQTWIGKESITGKIYKTMPLIEGIDLKSFLSNNTLKKSVVAQHQIAISLVKHLMQIHSNGIIHNDLHSNNVMIDDQLNALLIDFGKSIDTNNKPTIAREVYMRLGRLDTLAPEIVEFKKAQLEKFQTDASTLYSSVETPASVATDVYALGHIFNEQFSNIQMHEVVEELIVGMQERDQDYRLNLSEVLEILESPEFIEIAIEYDQKKASKAASAAEAPGDAAKQILDGYDHKLDDDLSTPSPVTKPSL